MDERHGEAPIQGDKGAPPPQAPPSADIGAEFERECRRELRALKEISAADCAAEDGIEILRAELERGSYDGGVGLDASAARLLNELDDIDDDARREASDVAEHCLRTWAERRGYAPLIAAAGRPTAQSAGAEACGGVAAAPALAPVSNTLDDLVTRLDEDVSASALEGAARARAVEDIDRVLTAAERFVERVAQRRVRAWAVARGLAW